jgi:hypothetical protein
MEGRRSQIDNRPQPPLTSGDSMHTYSQNVAGLWLKYGAKSLKNRDFFAVQDSIHRCDDLLTMGVDNPERGGL